MNTEAPSLTRLYIDGLHGDKNVTVNFKDGISIISSDNGAGKTTVLNILFLVLDRQLTRLAKINFRSVRIFLSNGENLELFRQELELTAEVNERRRRIPYSARAVLENIADHIDSDTARMMLIATRMGDLGEIRRTLRKIIVSEGAEQPPSIMRYVTEFPEEIIRVLIEKRLDHFLSHIPYRVIYLPTYRRVEENSAVLGVLTQESSDWEDHDESKTQVLIHFGMKDVIERFAKITDQIKDNTVASYSKISGRMLEELLVMPNFKNDTVSQRIRENEAGLTLVLNRIGSSISKKGRDLILRIVRTGAIANPKYNPLAYFLGNLIKIYEDQKWIDDRINVFVNTVNYYFTDKKLMYDEVDPRLYVTALRTEKEIDLETLSSGEKQLISILSLLYLEEGKFALIFDEPELSLSTDWQERLLPDIVRSGNCRFLLAATHSPYIFDNEFINLAMPMLVRYED